jgi:RNA polymerase sigma factor FliA
VTRQTLGRLWARYGEVRGRLRASGASPEARSLRREADQLRDRLVVNYSPLVKYVVGRVGARMTGTVDHEDFASWGVLGLLDAIETFDPDRQTKFETYAIHKIRWAILDELRREDWIPRRVRMRVQEADRVRHRLAQKLRRPPTEAEVAAEMGVDPRQHKALLEQYSRAHVGSLDARFESADGSAVELQAMVADLTAPGPESEAESAELRERLVAALRTLEEQERVVATFYFYEGLTLKEIGKALGLTEGRISQVLRQALRKLRRVLSENPAFLESG